VNAQFKVLSKALAHTLSARQKPYFGEKLATYREARAKFRAALNADDAKYFAFQLWQEGIARYTEMRLVQLAAGDYEPGKEFQALKDFKPYKEVAREMLERLETELLTSELDK